MNHLKQIAAKLEEFELDAMLITSEPGEFYAVGFHGEGTVIVTRGECRYFTDSRYIESADKLVTGAKITQNTAEQTQRMLTRQAIEELKIQKLGFEEGYMTLAAYRACEKEYPCELAPAQKLLDTLRASKDGEEREALIQAQRIAERAFVEILKFIQPGMTEKEIAAKLVYDMLRAGAEKVSFDPIVVSGPNGSLPHGIPSDKKVERGEFITMDFGCKFGNYCSDMTRTVALGEPDEEMRRVYQTVLDAQLAGIAAARAGVPGCDIHNAAAKVIEDAGYGAYFGHGFGHSVGIEIHESPNANSRNQEPMPVGAAISAEPGIYLPGRFGVRIEDVLILREDGCENITLAPKELIIL
ncbi:aminopeptidase P family protein [Pseudoflavonifractor sp. 524-17]|uniref:M24 family metallopeptidase n=1 Tax=Pseudoflavonifractor sp. 524-17 TaxID=2304577 RepID=UPI00137ACBD9|nr:aminopeptidase P family protein [Pseudoflavonifractor sp. 524-17]NCE64505.1 aminopeptidase P family protein [Pseudoflavonifractor sp. 524-17]